MNKTALRQFRRLFLIERLPEPLEPKSAHLQLFDNYIADTRLRLRLIRDPQTKNWTRILQQHMFSESLSELNIAEIYLNESEYSNFEQFEGHEIRKNRYFHEFDRVNFVFDVYLGDLWGLNSASVDFENAEEMRQFDPPPFVVFEVTNDPFFIGKNLVTKKFEDVRSRVAEIGAGIPPAELIAED